MVKQEGMSEELTVKDFIEVTVHCPDSALVEGIGWVAISTDSTFSKYIPEYFNMKVSDESIVFDPLGKSNKKRLTLGELRELIKKFSAKQFLMINDVEDSKIVSAKIYYVSDNLVLVGVK